jgi:hypothetical protein
MKYIITESRLEQLVLNWLNSEYGNLERHEYPNYIYYTKNGQIIFDYYKKNGLVFINYDRIWSYFESYFSMNYVQIHNLLKEWVKKHYNLNLTTIKPKPPTKQTSNRWESIRF